MVQVVVVVPTQPPSTSGNKLVPTPSNRITSYNVCYTKLLREVEADTTATPQAMGVVALAALASGVGVVTTGGAGVLSTVVVALLGWVA